MTLTVIFRDEAPMRHLGVNCGYRTVTIKLTDEQAAQLQLCGTDEVVEMAILEGVPGFER